MCTCSSVLLLEDLVAAGWSTVPPLAVCLCPPVGPASGAVIAASRTVCWISVVSLTRLSHSLFVLVSESPNMSRRRNVWDLFRRPASYLCVPF